MEKQRCPEKFLLKFPAYYRTLPCNCPKEGTLYDYEEFEAYRACIEEQITSKDFMSYYEKGEEVDVNNASSYSISLFTDVLKLRQVIKSKRYKSIAKGIVKKQNGPSKKSETTTHVDWWLFRDAKPIIDFKVIKI
ncbi:MAG: hypothetical protein ACYCYI_12850 [Saccharofermentanales bacterium]